MGFITAGEKNVGKKSRLFRDVNRGASPANTDIARLPAAPASPGAALRRGEQPGALGPALPAPPTHQHPRWRAVTSPRPAGAVRPRRARAPGSLRPGDAGRRGTVPIRWVFSCLIPRCDHLQRFLLSLSRTFSRRGLGEPRRRVWPLDNPAETPLRGWFRSSPPAPPPRCSPAPGRIPAVWPRAVDDCGCGCSPPGGIFPSIK